MLIPCHYSGDQVTNNMARSSVGTCDRAAHSRNTLRAVEKNTRQTLFRYLMDVSGYIHTPLS